MKTNRPWKASRYANRDPRFGKGGKEFLRIRDAGKGQHAPARERRA